MLNPSNCLCSNLRRAARKLSRSYDAALAPAGINVGQFAALVTLDAMGEATVSELAASLDLERTALTRNLAVLERDGLVASEAGEDRRERRIRLSETGSEILTKARPLWDRAQSDMAAALGKRKASALLEGLNSIP